MTEDNKYSGTEKKVYSFTAKGSGEFLKWLNEPAEDISYGRNELLLKLFFGNKISTKKILRI